MIRILLTGKTGQVGYELHRSLQGLGEIVALDRGQMDLANLSQVRDVLREVKPALIVNPAAYTAVDKAESEQGLAKRINAEAPAVMAEEAYKLGAAIIHYSTDYVFDGCKTTPYTETDLPCPISVYGATKLEGERAIQATGIPHLILRTSWVYGTRGKNFFLTVLRLAQERDELRMVADQHGAPTWCRTIADTTSHILARLLRSGAPATESNGTNMTEALRAFSGIYHLTAQGQTTWYDFAKAIIDHPSVLKKPLIMPIATQAYPLPAKRPANSALSCDHLKSTFCGLPQWEIGLNLCRD